MIALSYKRPFLMRFLEINEEPVFKAEVTLETLSHNLPYEVLLS
jgi:hypothetical protein